MSTENPISMIDEFSERAELMVDFLKTPYPGLLTWCRFYHDQLEDMARLLERAGYVKMTSKEERHESEQSK